MKKEFNYWYDREETESEKSMQRENKWQDRFTLEFIEELERNCPNIVPFIQSEIDTAIAEERKRSEKESSREMSEMEKKIRTETLNIR